MNKPEWMLLNTGVIVTAVVIDIANATENFVLSKIRNTEIWMFPGGCTRSFDIDPLHPDDQELMARNALRRILKDRFNLTEIATNFVEVKDISSGEKLYVYLTGCDFQGMTKAPYIRTFSDSQILLLNMPKTHKEVLASVINGASM